MKSLDNDAPEKGYAENAEFWVKIIRERLDRYRSGLTDEAVLNVIGPCSGMTILDAGCGEGYLSRALAQQGTRVIGLDTCEELVESARRVEAELRLGINYYTGNVNNIPIADGHCDVVVCNHLINDLQNISAPFCEFARVTREGGRLIILMLHPCFYGSHAERSISSSYPTPDEYFRVRTVEQHFVVSGIVSPMPVTMWFRPLEEYVSELRDVGFFVTSLTEPHPSGEQLAGEPWWRENFRRPLFMLIVAEKGRGNR